MGDKLSPITLAAAKKSSGGGDTKQILEEIEQTPVEAGGETLSTIDDKLNFLAGNIVPVLDREVCTASYVYGSSDGHTSRNGFVRKPTGDVVSAEGTGSLTTDDFMISGYSVIKANKDGKYIVFGIQNMVYGSPISFTVNANVGDTIVDVSRGYSVNTIFVIIRLD